MTREEEIERAAEAFDIKIISNPWTLFQKGAEWADRLMVEKACEWLRNNWYKYINIDADGVVCFGHWENDFRKAMKGE